eukprot:12896890-Prorocentrum_lima.AAC.1
MVWWCHVLPVCFVHGSLRLPESNNSPRPCIVGVLLRFRVVEHGSKYGWRWSMLAQHSASVRIDLFCG